MEQQRQHQQNMQNANVWGNVAASFLGAAAGVAVSHSWHSHDGCSSHDSCSAPDSVDSVDSFDISGVSDDTGFDFGGDD
jgi:hypothetical protein